MTGRCVIWRAILTLLVSVSWLLTSTHCVFAAVAEPPSPQAKQDVQGCPMHAKPAPQPPNQKKNNGCAELPCCKNLPAAKPNASTSVAKPTLAIGNITWLLTTKVQPEHGGFPSSLVALD